MNWYTLNGIPSAIFHNLQSARQAAWLRAIKDSPATVNLDGNNFERDHDCGSKSYEACRRVWSRQGGTLRVGEDIYQS